MSFMLQREINKLPQGAVHKKLDSIVG